MRNSLVWLSALLFVCMGISPAFSQDIVNLLTNPGLEDGTANGWGGYGDHTREVVQELAGAAVPEGLIEGGYCMHVTVGDGAADFWNAGLTLWPGNVFESGKQYTFSVWLKSLEGDREINFKPEQTGTWAAQGEKRITMTEEWAEYYTTSPVMTADVDGMQISVHVGFGAGEFWMDAAKLYVGEYVPTVIGPQVTSTNPSPAHGAGDVPRDTALGWEPSDTAGSHNLYFGDSFADVNSADLGSPLLVSQGQTENTYTRDNVLEFSKTYYWRVDDINATPDKTLFTGEIWSFTSEPFSIPLGVASVSASSATPGMGPENTINGSGLTGANEHDSNSMTMWLSDNVAGPHWIQYEFDRAYKLNDMVVWNQNQGIEAFLGFGAKGVVVAYSVDSENWTVLESVTEFAQATGLPAYAANTMVDFAGAVAQSVRITINDNWGTLSTQSGLAELQFSYIPTYPRTPQPADGSTTAGVDMDLSWRSGRGAASHQLSLGTSYDAVADGTAVVDTTTEAKYGASLDYGTAYYWQTVEINDADAFAGPIWSFNTPEYRTLEDFESYGGEEGTEVFMTWWDGFGGDASLGGSTTGYIDAPFVETSVVNSGRQSLPMFFDNNGGFVDLDGKTSAPTVSEVMREFDDVQDLTLGNATTLAVAIRGNAPAFAEDGNGNITMSGAGADIWNNSDEFRYAYKTLSGDGSMTVKVNSIVQTDAWAKAGPMIRVSTAADSEHAFTAVTPAQGISFQRRPLQAGSSEGTDQAGPAAPYWVRITRTGNLLTGELSDDGVTWMAVNTDPGASSVDIPLPNNVLIGLAVTSHSSGDTTVAEFSDLSFSGNVTGTWQVEAIGVDQPSNDTADPLYLTLADSSGKTVTVTHPDAGAVQSAQWRNWLIPLAELDGIRLDHVKSVAIGVGSSNGAGGEGIIYVDDLRVGTPAP